MAVSEAGQIDLASVLGPALAAPAQLPRLRALLTAWRGYLLDGVFAGGRFISATTAECGHRNGPVAHAVRALKRDWVELLTAELATAGSPDPEAEAFRIDAYLAAGNKRRELLVGVRGVPGAVALSGSADDVPREVPTVAVRASVLGISSGSSSGAGLLWMASSTPRTARAWSSTDAWGAQHVKSPVRCRDAW